jgi:hypothetical protein
VRVQDLHEERVEDVVQLDYFFFLLHDDVDYDDCAVSLTRLMMLMDY